MSHNNPIRIKIVIIFVLIVFLCQTIIQCSAARTLTAKQRAEIEKLRIELTTAFENDEERQLQAAVQQGVVVQPTWTQGDNSNAANKDQGKVVVTNKDLTEAEALRAEINKAVSKNKYVVAAPNEADAVRKVEAELSKKGSSQTKLGSQLGSTANDPILGQSNINAADMHTTSEPNVVEASANEPDIDVRKLQRLEVAKRRTREMLVLAHIDEDFSFTLGADVKAWQHIVHNGSEYFIGQREHDLLLIQQQQQLAGVKHYAPMQTLTIRLPISYLTCYQFWNRAHELQEGVILVAMADQVHWYRYDATQAQFNDDWQWHVGTAVTGLTHFTIDEHQYLIVSSNQSMRTGYYALNIYEYDLITKEFWLAQRMQLANASAEVTILDTGRDILLAVPQIDTAVIYAFNPRESASPGHVHFQLRHSIVSVGIDHIAAFQMGGRSYLALGGLKPQILQYTQGALQPKTILSHNFGLVELFMPVPVRTYRDDLLLLVQHRVDFSTHTLVVLDVLIWNGEAFEASIPVPCQLGEHIAYGVSCMLDIRRDAGLRGAALLGRGNTPLLIVPRHSAESGLFRLHTELLARNSELVDLQEIWAFLKDWVHEQDTLIAQAQAFLAAPLPTSSSSSSSTNTHMYDTIITPELLYDGNFDELRINDYKWTPADMSINMHDVLTEIRAFEQELHNDDKARRGKRALDLQQYNYDSLDFDEVIAEELLVTQVNNLTYYIQNGTLNFDGLLNVRDLEVLEELQTNEPRQMYAPELKLNGELSFERINGLDWSTFVQQLVWRNKSLNLERLVVKGEVIAEDTLHIDVLNGNTFPYDFMWSHSNATSIVRAAKNFTGVLSVNAVDMEGTINGVNPLDAITLSDAQDWPGLPTFAKLEVSEIFELNGTAQGRNFEQAPPNPTLLETHELNADCNFAELIVNGALRLQGTFDGIAYDVLLNDIVQRASDATQTLNIAAPKHFNRVTMPVDLQVGDAAINGIDIDDFVTTNTEQTLQQLHVLDGYVYINELQLAGAYDGVRLDELLAKAIHLDAPILATTTQLNFVHTLYSTTTVEIGVRLNEASLPHDYQTLYEDLHMPLAHFEDIVTPEAHIHGNIVGAAQLNGKNLKDFLMQRDWQAPQSAGNIFLNDLILPLGLQTEQLHGINTTLIHDFLQKIDELPLMILNGQIEVEHIHVRGITLLKMINGKDFDADIQRRVIWLNRPNYLSNTLTFLDDIELQQELNILGNYNERNMPDFIADIVYRTDAGNGSETLVIIAPKQFRNDVRVYGSTHLLAINGVPFIYIANTRTPQDFYGNLSVQGKLHVLDISIEGTLNDYPMAEVTEKLRFMPEFDAFVQCGIVSMPARSQLNDLTVYGRFGNATQPLATFFSDIIYKNQQFGHIQGTKIFTGRVAIAKGAHIDVLNELDVSKLLANVVYANEALTVLIQTPVTFTAPLRTHRAIIYGTLSAPSLSNCMLSEWLREAVRVDQPKTFAAMLYFTQGALNNNNLTITHLNDVDLTKLLTLYTAQNLTSTNLLFNELHLAGPAGAWLDVSGSVNSVNLTAAYENTLFINGNAEQLLSTPLILKSVHVHGDLITNAPINGDYDLRYLASLHAPQLTLETPLYFQQLEATDVRTTDAALISGIDFKRWHTKSLWAQARAMQTITGNWSVRNLMVKEEPMWPIEQRQRRHDENKAIVNTNTTAGDVAIGYQIKYLALNVTIHVNSTQHIRRCFVLNVNTTNTTYLLLNTGCASMIYKWQANEAQFIYIDSFDSGPIDVVQTISNNNNNSSDMLQFITSYENTLADIDNVNNNCTKYDMQKWRMENDTQPINSTKITRSLFELFLQRAAQPFIMFKAQQQQRQQRQQYSTAKILKHPTTEIILRPQIKDKNNFTFDDFRAVIIRIIDDLIVRLNTEMNITQLSIPESDLYHQQFYEDFLSVMHELRAQKIYTNVTFINLTKRHLPKNPAQVLAARTVQIIWPVIVEIEEIHGYLRVNETHAHPLCDHLKFLLGDIVHDVLQLAYKKQQQQQHDETTILYAVIERIRDFQFELEELAKEMSELSADETETIEMLMLMKETTTEPELNVKRDIIHIANADIAALSLSVGPLAKPKNLLAQLGRKAEIAIAANMQQQHDQVALYHTDGRLYQTLPAQRPRLLCALRIRDITLLAFVEDCCHVRILSYRGVQGFVEFADFHVATPIVQLLTLELTTTTTTNGKFYGFAVALSHELRIYEVVMTMSRTHL